MGSTGQAIDEEIAVGGHGVEARFGGDEPPVRRRNVIGDRGTDQRLVVRQHRSLIRVGVDRFIAVVVLGGIYGGIFTPTEGGGFSVVFFSADGEALDLGRFAPP